MPTRENTPDGSDQVLPPEPFKLDTGPFDAPIAKWHRRSRGVYLGYGDRLDEGFRMLGIEDEEDDE